jgi:hypothetical protein
MTITIDLAALTDWETGAPEPEPNRDTAFDADEALGNICPGCNGSGLETIYHAAARDWETGEPLDSEETHCRTCGGGGYLTEPAHDADEAEARADWQKPRPPALPAPWAMSLRELDSWHDHYARRDGSALGLSNVERRHRAEVDQNIFRCHEARRHSSFS